MIGISRLMEILESTCRPVLKGGKVCRTWRPVKVSKRGEAKLLRAEETDNMLETYYRREKLEGRHK